MTVCYLPFFIVLRILCLALTSAEDAQSSSTLHTLLRGNESVVSTNDTRLTTRSGVKIFFEPEHDRETEYQVHGKLISHPYKHKSNKKVVEYEESLDVLQNKVISLEKDLQFLQTQITSHWDEPSIVHIIVKADQCSAELKQLSQSEISGNMESKVEKLKKIIENIKSSVFLLIQSYYEHQKTKSKQLIQTNYSDMIILIENFADSIKRDLEIKDMTDASQLQNVRDRIDQLLMEIMKLGSQNIPDRLKYKVKELEQRLSVFEKAFINKINQFHEKGTGSNQLSKSVVLLPGDAEKKENPLEKPNQKTIDQQQNSNIQEIKEWMNSLETYLQRLESKKDSLEIQHLLIFQVNILLYKILSEIEKPTSISTPDSLKSRCNQLKIIVEELKGKVFLLPEETGKTVNPLDPNQKSTDPLPNSNIQEIKEWMNSIEIYLQRLKSKKDSLETQHWLILQINIWFYKILSEIQRPTSISIPDSLKRRFNTLRIIVKKLNDNILLLPGDTGKTVNPLEKPNKQKIEQIQNSNIQKIKEWMNSLDTYLQQLESKKDSLENQHWLISQVNILFDKILSEIQRPTSISLPDRLKIKIHRLKIIVEKLNDHIKTNKNLPEQDVHDDIKTFIQWVYNIEEILETLHNQLSSNPDKQSLLNMNDDVDQILSQLKEFEVEIAADEFRDKIKYLEDIVKNYKMAIKEMLKNIKEKEAKINKHGAKPEPFEKKTATEEDIVSLENSFEYLKNEIHSNQPFTSIEINFITNHLLENLKELKKFGMITDNLKSRIAKLEDKVNSFKSDIDRHGYSIHNVHGNSKLIDVHIKELFDEFEKIKIIPINEHNQLMLMQIVIHTYHIENELNKIRIDKIPENLQRKCVKLEEDINDYLLQIMLKMKKHLNNLDQNNQVIKQEINQTKSPHGHKFQQHFSALVIIYEDLNKEFHSHKQSDLLQISAISRYVIDDLKQLLQEDIPGDLQEKIFKLKYSAQKLNDDVNFEIKKQNSIKDDNVPNQTGENMIQPNENLIKQLIDNFEIEIKNIKNSLTQVDDSSMLSPMSRLNYHILAELRKIDLQYIPQYLKVKVTQAIDTSMSIQQTINNLLEKFKPFLDIESCISDLLLKLDATKPSRYRVLRSTKIKFIRRDLLNLSKLTRSKKNHRSIQNRIRIILCKLRGLRPFYDESRFLDEAITNFEAFLKYIM